MKEEFYSLSGFVDVLPIVLEASDSAFHLKNKTSLPFLMTFV